MSQMIFLQTKYIAENVAIPWDIRYRFWDGKRVLGQLLPFIGTNILRLFVEIFQYRFYVCS